jgi:FkbM family methyltransferase
MASGLWNLRPYAYRTLDRPGGRAVLARLATWAARRETHDDVSTFFDGTLWMYRLGDEYDPGEPGFVYRHGPDFRAFREWEMQNVEEQWFHVHRPKLGDVMVDIGAGIGGEAEVFSRAVGDTGRVLSVEANPGTFLRLERRVHWNRLTNVTVCRCALVDRDRPVYIEDRQAVYERNTVSVTRRPDDLPAAIEGFSLDELCRRFGIDHIDFLKLNIEGAETLAIRGMDEMIHRTRAVCIACHDFRTEADDDAHTRDAVMAFLRESGFDVVTRDEDPRSFVRDHVHGIKRN